MDISITVDHMDHNIMEGVISEVLREAGPISPSDLEAAIYKRYAEKIYAVQQFQAITLNPIDSENPAYFTRYKYAPLVGPSTIRLFRFKRFVTFRDQDYYSCEIVHASLDDNPVYMAFSYAWGSLNDVFPILIEPGQFLMATKTLMEVLWRYSVVEDATGTVVDCLMWTDQLCINQYDQQERSQQVGMMARIYAEANKTILWLGEEDETARQAFGLVHRFDSVGSDIALRDLLFSDEALTRDEAYDNFKAVFRQTVDIPPGGDPSWKALLSFLHRPWFSRIWVFQEALLSSSRKRKGAKASFVCGSLNCEVFHLFLARRLLFIDWPVLEIPSGYHMIGYLMHYYACLELDSLPPLSYTLYEIGDHLHCGNPRDRVYGFLGIQSPTNEVHIPIDYKKSVEDVYIDCARRIIDHDQGLRVLEFIKESESPKTLSPPPGLPSWVPDWRMDASTFPLEGMRLGVLGTGRFLACKHLRYTREQGEPMTATSLVVKGRIVDSVVDTSNHTFQIGNPKRIEQYCSVNFPVRNWLKALDGSIRMGVVPERSTEDLKATIIRSIAADGFNDNSHATLDVFEEMSKEEALTLYNELEHLREVYENRSVVDGSSEELHKKLCWYTEVCKGRKLAVLEKYYIALGPYQARKGDCICILHGSGVPWVLRPQTETGTYEVVGQCFVDGLMYGEAVDWTEESANTFVLV
jgi:hypothetical protein